MGKKQEKEFWKLFGETPNAVLIIEEKVNKLDTSELSTKIKKVYSERLAIVEKNIGKISTLKFAFHTYGLNLILNIRANWHKDFQLVKGIIADPDSIEELLTETKPKFSIPSSEEIKKKVDDIIVDERLQAYLTPVQLSQLINLILEEKEIENNFLWNLNGKVEARYNLKIKPKFEQELREKVQRLKKEGKSKVAIGGILNIGVYLVNKFF